MGERLEPRAPPVSRANLLVGKLGLLHQTGTPCAKQIPSWVPFLRCFVAHQQQNERGCGRPRNVTWLKRSRHSSEYARQSTTTRKLALTSLPHRSMTTCTFSMQRVGRLVRTAPPHQNQPVTDTNPIHRRCNKKAPTWRFLSSFSARNAFRLPAPQSWW